MFRKLLRLIFQACSKPEAPLPRTAVKEPAPLPPANIPLTGIPDSVDDVADDALDLESVMVMLKGDPLADIFLLMMKAFEVGCPDFIFGIKNGDTVDADQEKQLMDLMTELSFGQIVAGAYIVTHIVKGSALYAWGLDMLREGIEQAHMVHDASGTGMSKIAIDLLELEGENVDALREDNEKYWSNLRQEPSGKISPRPA